jgi:hypothetical protein
MMRGMAQTSRDNAESTRTPARASRQVQEQVVVTQTGSSVFRAVNFELYAKPTGWNKVMAYAGSALFVSIAAYWTFPECVRW